MKIKIIILLSAFCLGVAYFLSIPDEKIRLIFCDVGQGDGILVTRGSDQLVIDTGPDNKRMMKCLERYIPFWDKQIEAVVITHFDLDHSGGLADLQKYYKISQLWSGVTPSRENEQKNYTGNLKSGDTIRLGEIVLEILSPEKISGESNVDSVVGLLNIRGHKILLTGDATAEVEQRLVWRQQLPEKVEILKVSHHGSEAATSEELVVAVKPKVAVISVGKNKFGHPTVTVLERLKKWGVEIKRTDKEGDILEVF